MYLVLQVSTCLVLHTLQYKFCNFECFFKFSLNWGLTSFLYTLNGKFQLVQSILCSTWWELTRFSDKTWKWQWNESLQSILCSTWWELTRFSDQACKGWQSWLKIGIEPRGARGLTRFCLHFQSQLIVYIFKVDWWHGMIHFWNY